MVAWEVWRQQGLDRAWREPKKCWYVEEVGGGGKNGNSLEQENVWLGLVDLVMLPA